MNKPSKKYIARSYQDPERPRKRQVKRFSGLLLIAAILLGAIPCRGQVAVALSPVPRQIFWCAEAVGLIPCAGGTLTLFNAGTSVTGPVYTDSTGTFLQVNPVPLDTTGAATLWLINQGYDVVLKDSNGVQQWKILNVNPYQIFVSISSIILQPQTSDPAGQGGMLIYRSDIPCLRFFSTGWDCVVTLSATQTLVAKTLTSPTITTPTVTGGTFATPTLTNPTLSSPSIASSTALSQSYPNDTVAGTTLNFLAILSAAQPGAVRTFCTSGCSNPANGGAIGICVSNCTTSGNAQIAVSGITPCAFDGATTQNDYVGISQGSLGKCTDIGVAYPVSTQGQLVGRVLSTNVGAGTYLVDVTSKPEVRSPSGAVAKADLTTQVANLGSSVVFTPTANGFFRFTCFTVITQAATTSSTLPNCNAIWTDADTSTSQAVSVTSAPTANTVGTNGLPGGASAGTISNQIGFFAKGGVAISFSTTSYASVGATPMQYAVHVRVEGPL